MGFLLKYKAKYEKLWKTDFQYKNLCFGKDACIYKSLAAFLLSLAIFEMRLATV